MEGQLEDLRVNELGVDDANLLRASLDMNSNDIKMVVVRHKMLWSHARRNINLGDSTIETAAMPFVLGLIRNESDGTGAHLVQYHNPPLPMERFNTLRIDSVYRILRSRPELCENTGEVDIEKCQGEQGR